MHLAEIKIAGVPVSSLQTDVSKKTDPERIANELAKVSGSKIYINKQTIWLTLPIRLISGRSLVRIMPSCADMLGW